MKNQKKIPKFKSDKEERDFWAKSDSIEYIDWSRSEKVLYPDLKPSVRSISIRLPEMMIKELKQQANKRDIPYQSLIKMYLQERIENEIR